MNQRLINIAKRVIPFGVRIKLRHLNWYRCYIQQSLFYANGQRVTCPIAGQDFKMFIRLNNDLITPSNGARSRQRLVWHYLKHEQHILTKKFDLLHVAPEYSFYRILSNLANIRYVPGDKMVEGYSNQSGIAQIDLTGLRFESESFDMILCNHVLEHIPDDKAAMGEMYRVLKKGGVAIITVPIDESIDHTYEDPTILSYAERELHFGQWDHVRMYGLDICERLQKFGFSVSAIRYGKNFSEEDYQKFGFCNDLILVASKPV